MPKVKSQSSNELFAIHFKGELLQPSVWEKYSKNYGASYLYGWRAPKKVYHKIHHARTALRHLPGEIQKDCEIVQYIPGTFVEHSKDTEIAYQKRQQIKRAKEEAAKRRWDIQRLQALQEDVDELKRKLADST